MSDSFKKEVNQIKIPEKKLDAAISSAIHRGRRKRWSTAKKAGLTTGAAAVLFCLFIASAFVSPTMAEFASKLPFLNQVFESKPIHEVVSEKLSEEYDVDGIGMSYSPKKEFYVTVIGSQEYYESVKDDIKEQVEEILASRGYDAFKVKISMPLNRGHEIDTESDSEFARKSDRLMQAMGEKLKEYEDTILSSYTSFKGKRLTAEIEISKTETRTAEIEQIIQEIANEQQLGEVPVNFHKIDIKKREQEGRWQPIISTISEGMMARKEYKVKGIGYSNHPSPMTVFVTLQVPASDSDAKELAERTEETVNEFIQSEDAKEAVKDDPYKIVIYSKDREILLETNY
ncbi:DUF4030 domain-containing protein [Rossellomorea vietnamensis]|uniref:DUF4030 domain-containing protein n=1 Tax=Rossellomorea vietnamensis TaxID=218284 RepID=A0A5D4K8P1_9BACI|nr:DUF4030 domain-containing protein [Rossellomorea vietnamensis]TYR73704.1 DUF4030 domain-containing protein [Rossellomorea vietnamensis]